MSEVPENATVIKIDYKPTERQLEAHLCREPYILYGGAVGGGKSVCIVNDALKHCLDFQGARVGIFRWENKVFKDTTFEHIDKWILGVGGLVISHNKQERVIELINGSKIKYGGLKPSTSASGDIFQSIKSLELSAIYID